LPFFVLVVLSLGVFALVFYAPGSKLHSLFFPKFKQNIPVSFAVGLSTWALASYFLSYIGLRQLLWVYLGIFVFLYLKKRPKLPDIGRAIRGNKLLFIVIGLGVIFQVLSVAPSGIKDKEGVKFYHVNGYDGIYYLALDENLVSTFPPNEPGLSGKKLINYHFFSNLVTSDVSRMFGIPATLLHFQAFPLVLSFILGLLAYQVGLGLSKSKIGGVISAFLVYFGSDLGYLVSTVLLGKFSVGNLQAIDRSTLLFVNPPRAFSYIVLLAGILLLFEFAKSKKLSHLFFAAIILSATVGFKIYVGIFAAATVTLYCIWSIYKGGSLKAFAALVIIGVVGAAIFFPNSASAGGLFWAPLNWPRHYFASTQLQDIGWHLQEQEFLVHNNIPRIILLYLKFTVVFLLTAFGTRILGFWELLPRKKNLSINLLAITIPTILFLIVGLLFLQKSGIFETFNFFSVAALGASFLTAKFLSTLFSKKRELGIVFSILVVIMTLPRPLFDAYGQLRNIISKDGGYTSVSKVELSALEFIRKNTPKDAIILAAPDNLLDYQTPYIQLFSQRDTFFSGASILAAHGQNTKGREEAVSEVFSSTTKRDLLTALVLNGVNYLYIKIPVPKALDFSYTDSEIFYKNNEVLILRP